MKNWILKHWQKIILFLTIPCAIFFITGNAFADIIQDSGTTNLSPDNFRQTFGTDISGSLSDIYIYSVNGRQVSTDIWIAQCTSDFNTSWGDIYSCNSGGMADIFYPDSVSRDGNYLVYHFNTPISFDSTKYYGVTISNSINTPAGSTSNVYTYGNLVNGNNGVIDLNFKLIGVSRGPATSISIDYPTATTTTDFSNFKLSFNIGSPYTPQNYMEYKVAWQAGTSTDLWNPAVANIEDFFEIFPTATSTVSITNVPKSFLLVPGVTYYAQAQLLIGGSDPATYGYTQIATSSIISFQSATNTVIDNFYTGFNETFGTTTATTSTSTSDTLTCGSNLFCKIMQYLFVPQNISMTTLVNNLQTKVPFGYFTLIKNQMQTSFSQTNTASSSPSLSFETKLGFEQASSSFATMTIPILDFTDASTSAIFGSSPYATFKGLIEYGLYISFAVYLFFRGKSIL